MPVLSDIYTKLTVLSLQNGEEITLIIDGDPPITTASDNIVVKFAPEID